MGIPIENPKSGYPRLLIISPHVFNQYTGSGVFLTNLFQGWPSDRLAALHADPFPPDTTVCGQFYQLGTSEMRWIFPFSLIQSILRRFRSYQPNGTTHTQINSDEGFSFLHKESAVKTFMKFFIGEEIPYSIHFSEELKRWINDFQPDLIYTLAGGPYMKLVSQIASKWRIPYVVHMMDDWPNAMSWRGLFGPYLRITMLRQLKNLLLGARVRLGICEAMCQAYHQRFGLEFQPFQNSIDLSAYHPFSRTQWQSGSVFRIVYIGSILPNAQLHSLKDITDAVQNLRQKGFNIEMKIYSPFGSIYRTQLEHSPTVVVEPALDGNTVFPALTSADLLVIPVNFDAASVRYIRYSMPAKIPLYMISGTPILVYGPRNTAVVDYVLNNEFGCVVHQKDARLLESAISRFIQDESLRSRLGVLSKQVARRDHDAQRNRLTFQQVLRTAGSNGSNGSH